MAIKLGDRNQQVADVQKMLSLLGYDLIIDGHFGNRTASAVKEFQSKKGLINDGIVGSDTMAALKKSAPSQTPLSVLPEEENNHYDLNIIKTERLSESQFIREKFTKKQIFLHFTAGGPAAKNVVNSWESDEPRVATAFIIDRGTADIYECFNPDFWSYHLGIKGTNGRLDKVSIGIELCSYGPLRLKNGNYYAWPDDYSKKIIPEDDVYVVENGFRGFKYFESLTDEQIIACEALLESLITTYEIPVQYEFDYSWFDYNADVIRDTLPGIWTHTTVRNDKSDLYPDHRILEMLNRLATKYA